MDAKATKPSFDGRRLRCTPQRYAVMAFLMELNSHPTGAEIFEAVYRDGSVLGRGPSGPPST